MGSNSTYRSKFHPSPAREHTSFPYPARLSSIFRANPFPEVTDLICRLPLPTLFYRPEAAHLGDLLRIWVRTGTTLPFPSPRFSRFNKTSPDITITAMLFAILTLSLLEGIPGYTIAYAEKKTLPEGFIDFSGSF